MKKSFFLIVLMMAFTHIFSQNRLYLDNLWQKTTKDKAFYYREVSQEKKLFKVSDFYISGKPQMIGTAIDTTLGSEVFHGNVIWYYPDGKVQEDSNYKNGKIVGASKYYDEKGRLIRDFFYKNEDSFDGVAKSYPDREDDDFYHTNNTITYYKDGVPTKTVEYDKDTKGIRKEKDYLNNGYAERYYDEKGKLIGNFNLNEEDGYSGTKIDYYSNPMAIRKMETYSGKGVGINKSVEYYKNGKIKQEYTLLNGGRGIKKTYDSNGELLGELEYENADDSYEATPYQGTLFSFFDKKNEDKTMSSTTFESGKVKEYREFYETGEIKVLVHYGKDGEPVMRQGYDSAGNQTKLLYENGLPFAGNYEDEYSAKEYKKGELIWENKFKYTEDDVALEKGHIPTKIVIYERKLVKDHLYEVKIFDEEERLINSYNTKSEDSDDGYFTGSIQSYENGQPIYRAVFEDGILKEGKLKVINSYGNQLWYKEDDWTIKEFYNKENEKVRIVKYKQTLEEESATTVDGTNESPFSTSIFSY